jgi:hypothetical protein
MTETDWEKRTGLNEVQVVRLFKSAIKDDETLVDGIVDGLYRKMKMYDSGRAKETVELVVDRDVTALARLKALLAEMSPRRS